MKMTFPNTSASRLALAGGVGFSLALLVAAGFIFDRRSQEEAAHVPLTTTVSEKVAALNIKSRTGPSMPEKITLVRNAISRGDFLTAQRSSADVLANSHMQSWRFYPFDDFVGGIVDLRDPTMGTRLDEWVERNGSDPIPLLIRARYHYEKGWSRRGHGFISEVKAEDIVAFEDYMRKALADIEAAVHVNDGIPYGFQLRLAVLQGIGQRQDMMTAFEAGIKKFPAYYPLYRIVLSNLQPKWGGTVKSMHDFVDRYAGEAPENSPLKLLYLELYADLLNSASLGCSSYKGDEDGLSRCVASVMERTMRPELEKQVQAVFRLYDHTDRFQFGIVIKPILADMLHTPGLDAYSVAVLQWAADRMHSNTQLVETQPTSNNYIIDLTVADSWFNKGFYDNALTKNNEALRDLAAMPFPSGEEKDLEVSRIYSSISRVGNRLRDYIQMITYEEAAIALGGRNDLEHFICYGYYQLKQFDAAVQACDRLAEFNPDNLLTFYWRGQLYRDLRRADDALRDLARVADSDNSFRQTAAIDMSVIYFNRNDNQNALRVLNKYSYLYDPKLTRKDDVAVAFNNRCYAYMELGELQKALADCTASLKFGSLPDAFHKQEELVKRLGTDRIQL